MMGRLNYLPLTTFTYKPHDWVTKIGKKYPAAVGTKNKEPMLQLYYFW